MAPSENSTGKTVTFLQPGSGTYPSGGLRVVYEYANGLAERGWRVRIIHPRMLNAKEIREASPWLKFRKWLSYRRWKATGRYRPDNWFKLRSDVEIICAKTLEAKLLPPSDAWVATYWDTANWAAKCPGAHLYLIQHLETWCGPENEVLATWKLPLQKIVIARWLQDVAKNIGEQAEYVPNGLDFRQFGIDVPPEERDPRTLAMVCYLSSEWKGFPDGLRAICKVKDKVPGLRAHIFGLMGRPAELPSWMEYHENLPQDKLREIYNSAAIFVSPSLSEGWGLCPCEAMQCGSALAVTDVGGHREYAIHEKTALLSPPKDPDALAANVLRLIENNEFRVQMAHAGAQYVQQFTWERAVTSFETVLKDALAQADAQNSQTACIAVA